MFGSQPEIKFIDSEKYPSWISKEALLILDFFMRLGVTDDGETISESYMEWPEEAWQAELEFNKRYNRCFLSLDMEYCWQKASNLFPDNPSKGQVWFALALWQSFPPYGPNEPKILTNGEAEKWRKELLALLEKAGDLIWHMPLNWYGWNLTAPDRLEHWLNDNSDGNINYILTNGPLAHILVSLLVETLKKAENYSSYYGEHVNRATSQRTYFARKLTCAFIQETGKPYRKLIANTTSAAFDCSLTEREIIRTTKSLNTDDQRTVVDSTIKDGFHAIGLYPDHTPDEW